MTENMPTKAQILSLLLAWINQRPGLDFADYGDVSNYRSESRRITEQLHDAKILLKAVESSGGLDAETLFKAFRAFSGRLEIVPDENEFRLSYTTGQYWPTEYRAAACAVLASALWDYHRTDFVFHDHAGDELRKRFRRMFGVTIQRRWFN